MKTVLVMVLMSAGLSASAAAQQPATAQQGDRQQPEIPKDYKPPKGMCRIWLKDVPPAQQPAPTDCNSAVKNCPSNGRVIWGDTEESKNKPKVDPANIPGTKSLTGKGAAVPAIIPRKPPA